MRSGRNVLHVVFSIECGYEVNFGCLYWITFVVWDLRIRAG